MKKYLSFLLLIFFVCPIFISPIVEKQSLNVAVDSRLELLATVQLLSG